MKPEYTRADYLITEFEREDVITTSGDDPSGEPDNREYSGGGFDGPGAWF